MKTKLKKRKINKKAGGIPTELQQIMIDTSKSKEKRSSTSLLSELRYGHS